MNKAEKKLVVGMSREQVEDVVREMCLAQARLDEQMARMNEELARVRTHYQAELSELGGRYLDLEARARAWADGNPAEFAERRTLMMVHGTLGYRLGQPALKTVKGVTWDKALALLKANLPHYVRVREEPDKEALLADREVLGDDLRTLGLRVEQAERFFVEVNKEEAGHV